MDMKPSFKICKHYIQGGLTMRKLFTSLVAASIVASSAFVPLSTIADEKNIDFDEPELYHSVNDYTEKEKQLYELLQKHDPIPLSEIQAIAGTYETVSQEDIEADNKYYAEHYGLGCIQNNNDDELNRHSDIGTTIMNVSAEDDVIKNYSYFNSLSESELAEEYYEYCQEIGKDITKRSVENGIIKNDLMKKISKQVSWSTLNGCSLDITASYKWQKENNRGGSGTFKTSRSEEEIMKLRTWSTYEKEDGTIEFIPFYSLEYYGFDDLSSGWDSMFFDIDEEYISFKNSKLANDTVVSPAQEAEIKAHNYLCCLLTVYNSNFYNDYCKNCEGDVPEYNIEIKHHYTNDVSTSQKGDANVDGEVGLADALTILQYIANSQKYPMYEEGYEVADIVGDGDGVTPLDALEIQKWDANIF